MHLGMCTLHWTLLLSVKQWQTPCRFMFGQQDAHEFLSLLFMAFLEDAMDTTAQGMKDTFLWRNCHNRSVSVTVEYCTSG